jgi:hypothetical protein
LPGPPPPIVKVCVVLISTDTVEGAVVNSATVLEELTVTPTVIAPPALSSTCTVAVPAVPGVSVIDAGSLAAVAGDTVTTLVLSLVKKYGAVPPPTVNTCAPDPFAIVMFGGAEVNSGVELAAETVTSKLMAIPSASVITTFAEPADTAFTLKFPLLPGGITVSTLGLLLVAAYGLVPPPTL